MSGQLSKIIKITITMTLAVLILMIFPLAKINVIDYENEGENKPTAQITNDVKLKQVIVMDKNIFIEDLKIHFATHRRKNTSEITVEVYKNNMSVYKNTINTSVIKPDDYYRFENINLNYNTTDDVYILIYSDDAVGGNAVSVWVRSIDSDGKLYKISKNDTDIISIDGEIGIKFTHKSYVLNYLAYKYFDRPVAIIYLLYYFLSALILYLFYSLINIELNNVED